MAIPHRHQFLQASDGSATLTSDTAAHKFTNFRSDMNFRVSVVIYDATAILGNFQGGIYSEDGDDIQWGPIVGGDLSDATLTNGGATQLECRFDEIYVEVTGGTGKIRIMY